MKKPRILIINDDGIHAPGLKHLWSALVDHAEVSIIAPAIEQSGVGVATTLRHPLHVESFQWERDTPTWVINGTPADCVKMGVRIILDHKPDLIVSGINRGSNSGRNVFYSGTVGGVIEAVMQNIPGIAFSCVEFDDPHFEMAARHVYPIVRYVLDNPLPDGTFLNINVPNRENDVKGFKLARQGLGSWMENPDQRIHPDGRPYYWLALGGRWAEYDEHAESDVKLLEEGYLTAVPITVKEMTDHTALNNHKNGFEQLFKLS